MRHFVFRPSRTPLIGMRRSETEAACHGLGFLCTPIASIATIGDDA